MNLPSVIWKSTDYSLASPKTLWLSLIWNTRTLNPCDSVTSHGAMTPVLHSHPTRPCVFYGYYHAEAFATPACKWWLGSGLWKSLTTAVNQTWFLLLYCISLGKKYNLFFHWNSLLHAKKWYGWRWSTVRWLTSSIPKEGKFEKSQVKRKRSWRVDRTACWNAH